jgi:hypothetical protein
MSDYDDYIEMGEFLAGALRRQHREETMDDTPTIGHNRGIFQTARDAMRALSDWLLENPVIETPEQAKNANEVFSVTQRTLKDMEDERHQQVDPLNMRVKTINAEFKSFTQPLERGLEDLKRRLTAYVLAEEQKRAAEAARLRAEAEAAERIARAAEANEADAIAAVDTGVCEDVGDAIVKAEAAFGDYQRADRAAATAEQNVTVRLRSRFDAKARSLRNTEVLSVTDAAAAINAIGVTEKISEAIVSEARAYRKAHGALPPGISVQYVRAL